MGNNGNNGGQADEEIQRSSAWAERHGGGSSVCGGAESRLCSFSDVGSYSSAITVPARVILSHPFAYSVTSKVYVRRESSTTNDVHGFWVTEEQRQGHSSTDGEALGTKRPTTTTSTSSKKMKTTFFREGQTLKSIASSHLFI